LVLDLPRWSYSPAAKDGVRIQFSIDGTLCHESQQCCASKLQEWLREVCRGENALLTVTAPVLAPMPAAIFAYGPGSDPRSLLPNILPSQSDPELRHLAIRIAIEERPVVLTEDLRSAYRASRVGGGHGDYMLASTLLALGVIEGAECVVSMAHQGAGDLAQEARTDLQNWFRPAELGCPDAARKPDAFLAWLAEQGNKLELDTRRRTYRRAP
jgi:hypothetical protein